MATQVDNGKLYVARYCGPLVKNGGARKRVEIRRSWPNDNPRVLDIPWEEFKEIIPLGQELIKRCAD